MNPVRRDMASKKIQTKRKLQNRENSTDTSESDTYLEHENN